MNENEDKMPTAPEYECERCGDLIDEEDGLCKDCANKEYNREPEINPER